MRKANSLCAADIGTRLQITTASGVGICDTITAISMKAPDDRLLTATEILDGTTATILVQFRNVAPPPPRYPDNPNLHNTYFEVAPDAELLWGGDSNG